MRYRALIAVPFFGTIVPNFGTVTMPENETQLDVGVVLFGKARRGVLALLFGHPDRGFYLREIVKHAGAGTSQVQKELTRLVAAGLLLREQRGNLVYFRANPQAGVFD